MTLKDKYGIQGTGKVEEINLNENPYTFEGTFKEFYGLVASGRVKALKQNDSIVGISVSGYDTVEEDNLAGEAFGKAYNGYQALRYLDLATQLIEANLIPTIVSEDPLRITILNGLVTLNEYGEEVKEEIKVEENANVVDEEPEEILADDTYEVPYKIGQFGEKNIRNYIRYTEGRCLARGCKINIHYKPEKDAYEISGIQWGRKLTEEERKQVVFLNA